VILYQWRGAHRNFGDELNSVLWPKLLPDFFDQDEATRFLGIGSILDNRHDSDVKKLVAESGYGGYQPRIALDESWIVHWVRGQRTARSLGLPPAAGIGDPASLLPLAGLMPERKNRDVGFMPHFEKRSAAPGHAAAGADGGMAGGLSRVWPRWAVRWRVGLNIAHRPEADTFRLRPFSGGRRGIGPNSGASRMACGRLGDGDP
jgi:hypothetical protein